MIHSLEQNWSPILFQCRKIHKADRKANGMGALKTLPAENLHGE